MTDTPTSPSNSDADAVAVPADLLLAGDAREGLKWWREGLITAIFYVIYSAVRNQFGSAIGGDSLQRSFDNAIRVIDIEKAIGLYHEEWIQARFLDLESFIVFWNVFYGSFHFIVTIFVMVYLFLRFPQRYLFMRSTLASTTTVALVGFAFFPLMPPRLLTACPVSPSGARVIAASTTSTRSSTPAAFGPLRAARWNRSRISTQRCQACILLGRHGA